MSFLRRPHPDQGEVNRAHSNKPQPGAEAPSHVEVPPASENMHVAEQLAALEAKTGVSVADTIARLMKDHSHNVEPLTAAEKRGEFEVREG